MTAFAMYRRSYRIGVVPSALGRHIAHIFGMGPGKFFKTCIDWGVNGGQGISHALAKKAIDVYRKTHEPVVKSWRYAERAAIGSVQRNTGYKVNRCEWSYDRRFLWCRLPSGRRLAYFGPSVRAEEAPWGELMPKLYHWGVDSLTKKWVNSATYGGKLVENITQAVARDVMVQGVLNASRAGYRFLFSVHDEIVCERPKGKGSLEEFERLMLRMPEWAAGLPLKAKGWRGFRYKKG